MLKRKRILILIGVSAVFCLLSFYAKTGTAAWFVSESAARGSLVNAETSDLVDVKSAVTSCANDDVVQVKVIVTNKHQSMIPIRLGDVQRNIASGETVSVHISEQITEKATGLDIPFKGFEGYIDEVVQVPLARECVEEATKPAQEKAAKQKEKESDKIIKPESGKPATGVTAKPEDQKQAEHKVIEPEEEKPEQQEGTKPSNSEPQEKVTDPENQEQTTKQIEEEPAKDVGDSLSRKDKNEETKDKDNGGT